MKTIRTNIPSTEQSTFLLRLSGNLHQQYRDLAETNHRSINQEMITALENHAERLDTLDILINATREMMMRATESTHGNQLVGKTEC